MVELDADAAAAWADGHRAEYVDPPAAAAVDDQDDADETDEGQAPAEELAEDEGVAALEEEAPVAADDEEQPAEEEAAPASADEQAEDEGAAVAEKAATRSRGGGRGRRTTTR
ncbi:hypothetical protein SF23_03305 [Streptomyces sp. MBRL 10]|nr:hypothetical protein SF23_03305 [Streptomyces sp. MBRL 10]